MRTARRHLPHSEKYPYAIPQYNLAKAIAVLTVVIYVSACQGTGLAPPTANLESSSEEDTPSKMDGEWVRRHVMISTLERILTEEDSSEVIANTSDRTKESLLEGGTLIEEDNKYRLETDLAKWTVAEGLGDDGLLPRHVDNAMNALLWENEVTWCDHGMVGRDFVSSYIELYNGKFDTREEHEKSIADYVDCGTGEL